MTSAAAGEVLQREGGERPVVLLGELHVHLLDEAGAVHAAALVRRLLEVGQARHLRIFKHAAELVERMAGDVEA